MVIEVTFDVTDVYISTTVSPVYVNVSFEAPSGGGVAEWGDITGTLSDQTDLQTALDGKFDDPTGDTTQYIAGDGSLVAFPITGQAGTLVREVRNVTGATLAKGTVVYINGASGNKPTVAKAIATSDATSAQTFGLIQADIPNNSNGYLVAFGDLDGLDTSAFAEGVQLYLSATTAGEYTSTKQYAPSHLVYIGVVTRQHVNQGRIEVRIQNGYEMDELHDVAAQTPSNNDGLFYNSTNSLWENKSIGTALGYTPANAATTLTINGVTFDLSANRTFTVGSVTGSGASGQVAYWTGTSAQSGSNNLFWDATNNRLGIGTTTPITTTHIVGRVSVGDSISTLNSGRAFNLCSTDAGIRILRVSADSLVAAPNFELIHRTTADGANTAAFDVYANSTGLTFRNRTSTDADVLKVTLSNNVILQNGGTFTDGGQRLQVQGTTLLNGNVTFSSATGMFWDATNSRLGIGTNAPAAPLDVRTASGFDSAIFKSQYTQPAYIGNDNTWAWFGSAASGGASRVSISTQAIRFNVNGTEYARFGQTGNLMLQNGGTFTDSGERLQVTGDTLLKGSGATGGSFALKVQNSNGVNILRTRNDGPVFIEAVNSVATLYMSSNGDSFFSKSTSGTNGIFCNGPASASHTLTISSFSSENYQNGALSSLRFSGNFVSASGSTAFSYMLLNGTINQTGTSTSIVRGLYINPTLTSAADFRAIETARGNVVFGNLPTSSAGLPTGAIWNDAGTIKIV